MNKKSSFSMEFAAAALAGFTTLTVGCGFSGQTHDPDFDKSFQKEMKVIGEALKDVYFGGVEKRTMEELRTTTLKKLMESLDPHSAYHTPDEVKAMKEQTKGEFGGLGIKLEIDNNALKAAEVMENTPAAKAGMKSGDTITHVDGKQIPSESVMDAVKMIRGKPGTDVIIRVKREGESKPIDFTATRAVIEDNPVTGKILETDAGRIGYIHLSTFQSEIADQKIDEAIAAMEKDPAGAPKAYILDVRYNGGGLLDQVSEIADNFLESGPIASMKMRLRNETETYEATPGDDIKGKPLVILVNGGSASASEILAGTLQDHKRATVIGTQTYGKGSVQTVVPLGGDDEKYGALRLTIALYHTASGRTPQNVGITPDIEVLGTQDPFKNGEKNADYKESKQKGVLKAVEGTARAADPAPKTCQIPDSVSGSKSLKDKFPALTLKMGDKKGELDETLLCAVDFLQKTSRFSVTKDRPPSNPAP